MTLSPRQVRDLLDAHGLSPSRALGQNFVADPNTVRRIARLAEVGPGDRVVEIGPGLGSLTLALAETGAEVTAVELDRHLLPALREVVEPHGVRIVHGDALRLDWDDVLGPPDPTGRGRWWRTCRTTWPPRWCSTCWPGCRPSTGCWSWCSARWGSGWPPGPGDKAYGIPSVKVAYRADAEVVGQVPPTVFVPRPAGRVGARPDLRGCRRRRVDADPARLFRLVEAGFGQRRKMLRRSLAGLVAAEGSRGPASAPRPGPRSSTSPPGPACGPRRGPRRSDIGCTGGSTERGMWGGRDRRPAARRQADRVAARDRGRADGYHLIDAEMVSLDLADSSPSTSATGFEVVEASTSGTSTPTTTWSGGR